MPPRRFTVPGAHAPSIFLSGVLAVRKHLSPLIAALALLFAHVGTLRSQTPPQSPATFHFTVTSDIHLKTDAYAKVLDAMKANSNGQGAFQICVGDVVDAAGQSLDVVRAVVDSRFGPQALWYPVEGSHEIKSAPALQWLRDEFNKGNAGRPPLKNSIKNPGPPGCVETSYSFDYAHAHFVVLNEYFNGTADKGADGDIVPELLKWLDADLAANAQPMTFVFGHEPAFPSSRHVGNSLDAHPANRDAFWNTLVKYHVPAFFSGHTHYYYQELHQGVYQICDGNVGKGTIEKHQTYLDVIVGPDQAQVKVWQNDADGGTVWKVADTILLNAPKPPPLTKPSTP